jgi:hypothetical protein
MQLSSEAEEILNEQSTVCKQTTIPIPKLYSKLCQIAVYIKVIEGTNERPIVKWDKVNPMPMAYEPVCSALREYWNEEISFAEMRKSIGDTLANAPDHTLTRTCNRIEKKQIVGALKQCLIYNHDVLHSKYFVAKADEAVEQKVLKRGYYVFENYSDFTIWFNWLPANLRMFHEVTMQPRPRKAAFDIDGGADNLAAAEMDGKEAFDIIIHAVKKAFTDRFDYELTEKDIVVCDSSNEKKFSRHVTITNYHFSSTQQFVGYINRIGRLLPEKLYKSRVFDTKCTTSKGGSIRICHCFKPAAPDRVKRIISEHVFDDTILCSIKPDSILLPDLAVEAPDDVEGRLASPILDHIIQMCQTHPLLDPFLDFEFRGCAGTILQFNRVIPGHCKLCNRHHDSDGMYVGLHKNKVYAACHGFNHASYKDFKFKMTEYECLGELPWTAPMISAWSIWEQGDKPMDKLIVPLPNATVYEEEKVRDYDFSNHNTLLVRSGVGTEKTKALIRYMEAEQPERVVVVSFRKAFTEENIGKLPNFFDYRETDDNIDNGCQHKRVVIQFESMHRLACPRDNPPDLLVLDELESILDQMEHKVMQRQHTLAKVLAVFEHVMRISKRVIAMDAFLSNRSIEMIKSLRPEESISSQDNWYRSKKDDEYTLVPVENLYKVVTIAVERGDPIVIVSNTKRFARGINEHLTELFPGKKIRLYTGDNSCEKEVREELRNVNEAWKDLDVLIYTSTVLAGCNFEQKHFKYCFAHFSDTSVTAQGCLQMLGRVRDIEAKTYFITFDASTCEKNVYMQKESEISDTIDAHFNRTKASWDKSYGKKARIIAETFASLIPRENTSIEINAEGLPITMIERDWWYHTHVRNVAHINYNRNHFVREFLRLLRIQGCSLDIVENAKDYMPDRKIWIERVVETHDKAEWKSAEAIVNAPVSSIEEVERLMKINAVTTHEDHLRVEKIKFASFYDIPQDSFDAASLIDYGREQAKGVYTHLSQISKEDTIEESLRGLERKEVDMLHHAKNKADLLSIRNRSEKHRVALGFIELAGWKIREWKCPFDEEAQLSTDLVLENVKTKFPDYVERNASSLHVLFGKRLKALQKAGTMSSNNQMRFINGLLRAFYGVTIIVNKREPNFYVLKLTDSFKYENGRYWPAFYNAERLPYTDLPEKNHAAVVQRIHRIRNKEREESDAMIEGAMQRLQDTGEECIDKPPPRRQSRGRSKASASPKLSPEDEYIAKLMAEEEKYIKEMTQRRAVAT